MSTVNIIKHPIEKISAELKRNAWTAIIESIVTIALGIFLIVWPDTVVKVIAYVVGVFFIVKGAYQIINYLIVGGQKDFFNDDLLGGVISVLIGVAALLLGEEITNVFRIVVGIWMVYEALVRMNTAIKIHAAGIDAWVYVLIISIIMLLLGIIVTFYSGALATMIGWIMIVSGVIGIVSDTVFIQYVNKIADALTKKEK